MRQAVVCPHCQESFHVHFRSFLLGRLKCPHCYSRFRLIPSWTVCFLFAIFVVLLPDDHGFAGLIVSLLFLFTGFYLFLSFWVHNSLIRIKAMKNQEEAAKKIKATCLDIDKNQDKKAGNTKPYLRFVPPAFRDRNNDSL